LVNFPDVQFSKRQLPQSVLAAALCPIYYSSLAAPLGPISACGASEGLILLLEVDAWEIIHYLENFHLGNCQLGSRSRENANIKTPNTSFKDLKFGIMCSIKKALNIKRINLGFMNFYGNS